MKRGDEFVEQFRRVYLEEFGEEISREEAYDNFFSLVNVLRIILRPVPRQDEGHENPVSSSIDGGHGNGRLKKTHQTRLPGKR